MTTTYLDLNKQLTSDEAALKEQVHRFAAEVIRPAAMELDRMEPEDVIASGSPLWGVFKQIYGLGYHTRGLPEELGGVGLSPLAQHIYSEEMGWGACDLSVSLGVTAMPFFFASRSGNQELIREFVVPFSQDREARYIGCWAVTEPHHGSDAVFMGNGLKETPSDVAFELQAEPDGDDWVIRGQKSSWVSNGTIATHAMVHMGLDRSRSSTTAGIAFVPLNLPGVTRGKPLNKLGQRALNQGEIFFDNVRIPKSYMLVPPEGYAMMGEMILAAANAGMGATFTGVTRAAFEEGLSYARQRVQGGKPICEHQAVQLKLMDMFTKVECARALSRAAVVYNATTLPPAPEYSVASKVFCTQAAFEVASDALQLHGGMGLAKGMVIEKLFRDARASLIEDGSNDVLSLAGVRRILDRT
ncbi:MAG: acyl-CoA dehydrogenase family protein [Dehalococcoidia bacterium]|nr:acyl-CoA dehydrogenase family protein [Dehalococcoidia bacterium]